MRAETAAVAMKTVFAIETIDAGAFVVRAGEYAEFPEAEAARLIANGAAADPDQMLVPAAGAASVDAVVEAKDAEISALNAALTAAHADIDRLTTALAAAEKKK